MGEIHRVLGLSWGCWLFFGHKRARKLNLFLHGKRFMRLSMRFFLIPLSKLASGTLSELSHTLLMRGLIKWDFTNRSLAALWFLLISFLVWDQQYWWRVRDEYLFGFLVPFFVFWVLNERKAYFRLILDSSAKPGRSEEERSWAQRLRKARGLAIPNWVIRTSDVLVMGVALLGFVWVTFAALYRVMEGHNLVTTQLLAMSNALLLLTGVYIFLDRRSDGEQIPFVERWMLVGLFLFPALIWLLSAPLFSFLDNTIRTFLMNKVAIVVFEFCDVMGYSVVREGSVLVMPTGRVGVAEACSGIYSLMASLFAGSFLASMSLPVGLGSLWKKVSMVLAAMVFAFLTNIGRSLFLTLWAYHHGPEAIDEPLIILGQDLGSLHDFLGYAVIGPVVIALLILVQIFTFDFERPE
jgi:exosortase